MYKLFETEKKELTKAAKKEYKQFNKEILNHEKQKQNNNFLLEKEKELLKTFKNFDINIIINKKINSFQSIYFIIAPEKKEDLKNMMRNKKMLEYYLQTEIKQDKTSFIVEYQKEQKNILYLYDIIENKNKNSINVNIGKDTKDNVININIEKLPHLLIGGTTGSGKSVFINSFITSLIYNYTPEQLKLFLVDPKRTELKQFENIPHLYYNIVNDIQDVNILLDFLINEMYQRYILLEQNNCKNIQEYNEKHKNKKMKFYICIIDELADLMLQDKKNMETKICKIAQLSRACGIHLIIATQRPSTDIITGLIKSNFPSRLCFKVASVYDSRTILDVKGGEQLQGNGESILKTANNTDMIKLQTPFVSTEELEKIL